MFNSPTKIDDYLGQYTEVIKPGAFKRALQGRTPLMFNHGRHPLIGTMPIGTIEQLREDDRGLFVRARLFDNWLIDPLAQAIREEAVSGMSFRFEVPQGKDQWTTENRIEETRRPRIEAVRARPGRFPGLRGRESGVAYARSS